MTFFFFPPVSKRIFSTLHCAEMRPGEYFPWEDLVRVTLTLTLALTLTKASTSCGRTWLG